MNAFHRHDILTQQLRRITTDLRDDPDKPLRLCPICKANETRALQCPACLAWLLRRALPKPHATP